MDLLGERALAERAQPDQRVEQHERRAVPGLGGELRLGRGDQPQEAGELLRQRLHRAVAGASGPRAGRWSVGMTALRRRARTGEAYDRLLDASNQLQAASIVILMTSAGAVGGQWDPGTGGARPPVPLTIPRGTRAPGEFSAGRPPRAARDPHARRRAPAPPPARRPARRPGTPPRGSGSASGSSPTSPPRRSASPAVAPPCPRSPIPRTCRSAPAGTTSPRRCATPRSSSWPARPARARRRSCPRSPSSSAGACAAGSGTPSRAGSPPAAWPSGSPRSWTRRWARPSATRCASTTRCRTRRWSSS